MWVYTVLVKEYKIHDTKFNFTTMLVCYRKVVPLGATLRIDIVLHVELIGWQHLAGV